LANKPKFYSLKGHLEKIESDILGQKNLYDEDYEKRKSEVDNYTEKLDKHMGEIDFELEKVIFFFFALKILAGPI
jgi:hypothetical protein